MKNQILIIFIIFIFQISRSDSSPIRGKSRQLLPPVAGYIPVYIRPGNTPLEDINLDLAEAFESFAIKQGRLNSFRSLSQILEENNVKDENDISSISLDNINLETPEQNVFSSVKNVVENQHIQKIPKVVKT